MWAWNRSLRSVLWRRSLASKLKPPGAMPPARRISYSGSDEVLDRVRELVGVPAVLRVAAVGVDAAQHPVGGRERDLVVEAVAGQRGVVRLDVDPVLALEAVADEEAVDGRDVVVVLVLGRLHRLGLDEQLALEADLVLVLGDEVQEPGELLALAPRGRC